MQTRILLESYPAPPSASEGLQCQPYVLVTVKKQSLGLEAKKTRAAETAGIGDGQPDLKRPVNSLPHDTVQQQASTLPTKHAGSCPQFPASPRAGGSIKLLSQIGPVYHRSPPFYLGPPPWSL